MVLICGAIEVSQLDPRFIPKFKTILEVRKEKNFIQNYVTQCTRLGDVYTQNKSMILRQML